jgi:hypothetical protein
MNTVPEQPDTAIYVYCVAGAELFADGQFHITSPAIGGSGEPVRALVSNDLAAIVSKSPRIRYTFRREYLAAHQQVLEEVLARTEILPVSFGTLAGTDQQVELVLLQQRSDELHGYLEYIHGRVELNVRAHWDQDRLYAEILAENDTIRALRDSVAGLSDDAGYYERIELGELTQAAIELKQNQEAERILGVLEPLAVETKVNPELTDMTVLNAAFLVEKEREATFDETVQAIHAAEAGRLLLQYIGPVPPYNFVTVRVSW